MTENEILINKIGNAVYPIDIFGKVKNVDALKHIFNSILRKVHPDLNPSLSNSSEMVTKLNKLKKDGISQIQNGEYENPFKKFTIELKRRTIEVVDHIKDGSISNVYKTAENTVVKISKDPSLNKFLESEMDTLRKLRSDSNTFNFYLPEPLRSYNSKQNLTINELSYFPEYNSIEYYIQKYPNFIGVDVKTFAWVANRLFEILGFVHHNKIVHGAIVPSNILIEPKKSHALSLVDWTAAVEKSNPPKLMVERYKDYYPAIDKDTKMSYVIDIQMAVKVLREFAYRKWGDYDEKIKSYIGNISIYPNIFKDAWEIRDSLEELWKECIGKRRFYNEL